MAQFDQFRRMSQSERLLQSLVKFCHLPADLRKQTWRTVVKIYRKMLIKRELLHYLTVKYDEKASDNVTDEGMFGRPPMDEICRTVGRGGRGFTYTDCFVSLHSLI